MKLPNIWGEGQIFAYSGMDGKTDWGHPFVATTISSGLLFHTRLKRRLWFKNKTPLKFDESENIVTSDFINLKIKNSPGRIKFLFVDKDVIIGKIPSYLKIKFSMEKGGQIERKVNSVVSFDEKNKEYTCLQWRKEGNYLGFVFAFDCLNDENAFAKSKQSLRNCNLNQQVKKKLEFFKKLPQPTFKDELLERTYYKCFSVLKVNTESPQGQIKFTWTTPDRFPHKSMWLWDSTFHAVGWKYLSLTIAQNALKSVLSCQEKDGFIPCTMAPDKNLNSDVTQPPILSWASWDIYRFCQDKDFLSYLYPKLKAYILWDLNHRNKAHGLLSWRKYSDSSHCRCGESGMDNSPRFDKNTLIDIDFNVFIANEMEYLARIAEALEKEGERKRWEVKREKFIRLINQHLWDEKDNFYYDRAKSEEFVRVKTPASFLPLFAGIVSKARANKLVKHIKNKKEFWLPFPLPSVSADDPHFSLDMWRGPTWINYNYFIALGLKRYGFFKEANQIAKRTIEQMVSWYKNTGCIFEYYDPYAKKSPSRLERKGKTRDYRDGFGGAIRDYNWSAALFVAFIHSFNVNKFKNLNKSE